MAGLGVHLGVNNPPIPQDALHNALDRGIRELREPRSFELWQELTGGLTYWLRAHYEMEHSNPSPSSITACRYQQWCWAKKLPTTDDAPLSWTRRAAFGIMAEPYWAAILKLGGIEVNFPKRPYRCGPRMTANPDLVHEDFIVEIKDMTGWGYKELLQPFNNVQVSEPGHYAQLQLYMYATNCDWALYLVAPADPSLLQSQLRQRKKFGPGYEMPPYYTEWVPRNDGAIDTLLERAVMLYADLQSDEPPPREYPGIPVDRDGKKIWPCGYCPHQPRCVEQFGWGSHGY